MLAISSSIFILIGIMPISSPSPCPCLASSALGCVALGAATGVGPLIGRSDSLALGNAALKHGIGDRSGF